jgi:enoyl-CoA hydratase
VNQTVDNMGFYNSLQACFTMHQLNHAHWSIVRDDKVATAGVAQGVPDWRHAPPVVLATKTEVRAE